MRSLTVEKFVSNVVNELQQCPHHAWTRVLVHVDTEKDRPDPSLSSTFIFISREKKGKEDRRMSPKKGNFFLKRYKNTVPS